MGFVVVSAAADFDVVSADFDDDNAKVDWLFYTTEFPLFALHKDSLGRQGIPRHAGRERRAGA